MVDDVRPKLIDHHQDMAYNNRESRILNDCVDSSFHDNTRKILLSCDAESDVNPMLPQQQQKQKQHHHEQQQHHLASKLISPLDNDSDTVLVEV
jgi:hypothetical protein